MKITVPAKLGIAATVLKVVLPLVRRGVEKAVLSHCQGMVHQMEFGERPSCEMCYEMHRAMHRRMEREMLADVGRPVCEPIGAGAADGAEG